VRELDEPAGGIAWSPDGRRLAVTDASGALAIWDVERGSLLVQAQPHDGWVDGPLWTPDGSAIVTVGRDRAVRLSSAEDLAVRWQATAPERVCYSVALSGDGACVACAHGDGAVRVWETASGRELAILEGSDSVGSLAFSTASDVLAGGTKGAIKLWRRADWECVATLPYSPERLIGGLAFHPRKPILAAKHAARDAEGRPGPGSIDCWRLDYDVLLGREVARSSRRYVNAKVVLLGDTGVGKSGLGLVLSGRHYAPTDSTHGRRVWAFSPDGEGPDSARGDAREVLLWDLAGQPGYRMVHQLHLNEVAVALVVFDSRSETDPFAGVKHWVRALAQARRVEGDAAVPVRTFLVAARADRGGVAVRQQRVQALVEQLDFDHVFETSAKEGWQIAELKAALLDAIDWARLPTVSSNAQLVEIRQFLLDATTGGRVLATGDELFRGYCAAHAPDAGDRDLRREFDACLSRVESRGLVRRLQFGGLVLLQPELLDAYASALVLAAKDDPDGLGVIAEEDAIAARFRLPESERVASRDDEKLLLIAMVGELLRHEVALKEATDAGVDLVFPSQFTRERPDAPHVAGRALTFGFEGSLHNVYATLAVRLARSDLFARREMWRNAATYAATAGGDCGIYLREVEEGVGELDVFFDEAAADAVRRQFETYVFEHLRRRAAAGSVTRRRVVACPGCRYALPDDLVRIRRDRGDREMPCPACGECTLDLDEAAEPTAAIDAAVTAMHRSANAGRDSDVAATRLKGKVETNDFDVFLCHNSKDKPEVKAIAERLKQVGIHPWLDEWEIPPGARWQKELEKQLKSIRSAAVFVGSRSQGPWQDIETELLLKRFAGSKRPLIPVILASRRGQPRLPGYLPLLQVVDMREPDPDPFEQLMWGITGERARF